VPAQTVSARVQPAHLTRCAIACQGTARRRQTSPLLRFGYDRSPTSGGTKSFQVALTVGAPGEGHFMRIDPSISEARRARDALEYVIGWQEDLNVRGRAAPQPGPKGKRADRGRP
jgi:hypothetical protein